MMRTVIHLLLVVMLVLNPLQAAFAHLLIPGKMQSTIPKLQAALNHTPTQLSEAVLLATATNTSPLVANKTCFYPDIHATAQQTQHHPCLDCRGCVDCFVAIMPSWCTSFWPVPFLESPYRVLDYRVISQPALQPPRFS